MVPTPAVDAPIMLSVSGARGIVGASMTPETASRFAAAFASFVKSTTTRTNPVVCIGRDSRPSGDMLMRAATAGLVAAGCEVIELGVVATPTVGVMIGETGADGGLVITASHNPRPWNGLKCLDAEGTAPAAANANEIIRRFREEAIDYANVEDLRGVREVDTGTAVHLARVLDLVDVDVIAGAGLRVVLDSVNGAGCAGGRALLEQLGCAVVHLNGTPNGLFAHTPEPIKENLTDLAAQTSAEGAALGFAQDPDADRLAIIDEQGTYIGEEFTLALAARRMLDRNGSGVVAANLSTSRMVDDLAAQYPGSKVIRTAVGEANVVEGMKRERALAGGEGNGGVIVPQVGWVRDSLVAMALVLELVAVEQRPLSALVAELPSYRMIKHRFDLAAVGGAAAVGPAIERVRTAFADRPHDASDGIRIEFEDGWVHLRPSNTEPIVRLIAESTSDDRAWAIINEVAGAAGLA